MSGPAGAAVSPPLPILYADERLVVVDKPSGLLVHRSPVDSRETRFLVQTLRDQLGRRVHPVHRLDKGASGAIVLALDAATARALAGQFAAGAVRKRYLAVVRGWPDESGVVDRALADVEDEALGPRSPVARPAVTRFRRLATAELAVRVDRYATARYALVELEPLSGRRHQLRRHLAQISHPIIGDSTYGKGRHNRLFTQRFGSRRLLLACVGLEFAHPHTGAPLVLAAAPGAEFEAVLRGLGWEGLSPTWP